MTAMLVPLPHQGAGGESRGGFTAKSEYTRAEYDASAAGKEDFFARMQAVRTGMTSVAPQSCRMGSVCMEKAASSCV